MTLLELAERCEKATGPDRELDAAIACYAPICQADYVLSANPSKRRGMVTRHFDGGGHGTFVCNSYTASLDAAMTLANGYGGEVTFFKDGTAKAFLWQPYPMAIEAKAATPALALCAAALKARAANGCVPNTPEGDG
jgi:hypothetical protein